jgi:hypothetical protein
VSGVTEQHGLGRIAKPDPRDRQFLMARRLVAPSKRTVRKWRRGGKIFPLNQGQTGTCVSYSWSHYFLTSPVRNKLPMAPFDFYRKLILVDEWSENDSEANAPDNDLQFGSSVRAGAKAAKDLGLLSEYSWAFDGRTARQWVLDHSPVVVGTDWLWNMFSVDANGFIDVSGGIAGGHAYLWYGTDLRELRPDGKRGVDYYLNSWGQWGISGKGIFKMKIEDTDMLISSQGEACTATELKAST